VEAHETWKLLGRVRKGALQPPEDLQCN